MEQAQYRKDLVLFVLSLGHSAHATAVIFIYGAQIFHRCTEFHANDNTEGTAGFAPAHANGDQVRSEGRQKGPNMTDGVTR